MCPTGGSHVKYFDIMTGRRIYGGGGEELSCLSFFFPVALYEHGYDVQISLSTNKIDTINQ